MPYSILIVEDDLTFATMLKTWLGKKGFLVDTAGNSARARKQLDVPIIQPCAFRSASAGSRRYFFTCMDERAWTPNSPYYHDRLCRYPKCCTSHEKWCQ